MPDLTPSSVIINALGGTGAVSAALDVRANTVSGWRERGIPANRWASLVRLAAEKGRSDITFEALAEAGGAPEIAPEPAEARA